MRTTKSTVARGALAGATLGVLVLLALALLSQSPGLLGRVMDAVAVGAIAGGVTGGCIGAIIAERRARHR